MALLALYGWRRWRSSSQPRAPCSSRCRVGLPKRNESGRPRFRRPSRCRHRSLSPQLSPEELAALEAQAEQLLAQLLTQQARLTDEGAAGWGGEDWVRYTELAKSGDDAYLAKAFDDAVAAYNDALAAGEALFERSAQDVLRALENAQAAILAGNADLALQQYDFALGIEPENEDAKRGRARAERLPEVLTLSRQGDALRDEERLEDAAAAYRQALAIDSEWEPARSALDAVARQLASNQYESRMSSGFAALAEGEYQSAAENFRAALGAAAELERGTRRPGAGGTGREAR